MSTLNFDTTAYVEIAGGEQPLYAVTAVIHDDQKLFVTGEDGVEKEVPFEDVLAGYKPDDNVYRPFKKGDS